MWRGLIPLKSVEPISCGALQQTSSVRRLTVPVDLPTLPILQIARLHIPHSHKHTQSSCQIQLFEAIFAELTIEHTRRWSDGTGAATMSEFCYNIHASLEDWVIGGQRSVVFHAQVSSAGPRTDANLMLVVGMRTTQLWRSASPTAGWSIDPPIYNRSRPSNG